MQLSSSPRRVLLHVHSQFSYCSYMNWDGIIDQAKKQGLEEVAITDHSDAQYGSAKYAELRQLRAQWPAMQTGSYGGLRVVRGIEADLLDHKGHICDTIGGATIDASKGEFLILSAHPRSYGGDPSQVVEGYIKAVEKDPERIAFIGHPAARLNDQHDYARWIDLKAAQRFVDAMNAHKKPIEANGSYLWKRQTDPGLLRFLLERADYAVITGDAHTRYDMRCSPVVAMRQLDAWGMLPPGLARQIPDIVIPPRRPDPGLVYGNETCRTQATAMRRRLEPARGAGRIAATIASLS